MGMKEMMEKLREASIRAILESEDVDSLEALRVKYLGKKGELTGILRQMGRLSAEERPVMGQFANKLREDIEKAIDARREVLAAALMENKLRAEAVDVTLPATDTRLGHKHPMYNVLDQIKDIFIGMGFEILDGNEVELADYNFTKLNIEDSHPSREWTDTFYFTEDSKILLRTQTSPMQVHAMETKSLPIRMIAPGRVYRKDEVDATHSPMFHQIEGMVIDKGVTMADLKATLNLVVEKIYGEGTVTRFRPPASVRITSPSPSPVPSWTSAAISAAEKAAPPARARAGLRCSAAAWCIRRSLPAAALTRMSTPAGPSAWAWSALPWVNTKFRICASFLKMTSASLNSSEKGRVEI